MTQFNTQHDEFADFSIDELFDEVVIMVNEAQRFTDANDKSFYITQANTMLDYLSTRINEESK